MSQPVIVIGTGGHARRVAQAVTLAGQTLVGFADENPDATSPLPAYPLLTLEAVLQRSDTAFVVAIGNAQVRSRLQTLLSNAGLQALRLIHPRAYVAVDAVMGEGCVVLAGAIVESGAMVGKGTIIDIGAIVDHDTHIGQFCHIKPGAIIAARERLEDWTVGPER